MRRRVLAEPTFGAERRSGSGDVPRNGPRSSPADQGDLAALRDQAARAVPDFGFLVEPAAADVPAAGRDPQRPRDRHRAHVPGQLDRGRPADHLDAKHHRRQRVHRQGEQQGIRVTLLGQLEVPAHLRHAGRLAAGPARGGRVQPEVHLLGVAGEHPVRRVPRAQALLDRRQPGRLAGPGQPDRVGRIAERAGGDGGLQHRPAVLHQGGPGGGRDLALLQPAHLGLGGLGPRRAEEMRAGRDGIRMRRSVQHRAQQAGQQHPAVDCPGDGEPVIRRDLVPALPDPADRGGLVEDGHPWRARVAPEVPGRPGAGRGQCAGAGVRPIAGLPDGPRLLPECRSTRR